MMYISIGLLTKKRNKDIYYGWDIRKKCGCNIQSILKFDTKCPLCQYRLDLFSSHYQAFIYSIKL